MLGGVGWAMPRRGWRADSGAGVGLAALWGALLFREAIRRGCRGASGKPPVRPQAHTPAPVGIDAPTPAREKGLQPYGALDCFGALRKGAGGTKGSGYPVDTTAEGG